MIIFFNLLSSLTEKRRPACDSVSLSESFFFLTTISVFVAEGRSLISPQWRLQSDATGVQIVQTR